MNTSLLLSMAAVLLTVTSQSEAAVPKLVTSMNSLTSALLSGASVRYQIDDISKCNLLGGPAKMVVFDVSWELRTAYIRDADAFGDRTVFTSNEREVNGTRSMLTKPALRQINVAIHEGGTMDVGVAGFEFNSYFCFETYSYTCLWNQTDGSSGVKIYQQDGGGKQVSGMSGASDEGFALAYYIDASQLTPPVELGITWTGRITGARWSKDHSKMVFSRRFTDAENVTVTQVETSLTSLNVTIQTYTYSRKDHDITSSSTHMGTMDDAAGSHGNVHFFKLHYGE